MKIIKEYWVHDGKYHASIRTNTYCKNLAFVLGLYAKICRDYPEVAAVNVSIVVYDGGDRIKGVMGLEFPIKKPTKNYVKIHQPEYLLS